MRSIPIVLAMAFTLANIFVFPIPHTITLRYSFGASVLLIVGYYFFRHSLASQISKDLHPVLMVYAALTGWIIFQALAISTETVWALTEFKKQWLISSVYLFLGIGLVSSIQSSTSRGNGEASSWLLILIMAVLASQILFTVIDDLIIYFQSGDMPFMRARLTSGERYDGADGHTSMSYVSSLLLPILIADTLARLNFRKRLLPISAPILVLLFAADLFCLYLMKSRNSILDALTLLAAAAVMYAHFSLVRQYRKRIMGGIAVFFLLLGVGAHFAYRYDSRWQTFAETIPLALKTQQERSWMHDGQYPRLPDGRDIDASAYLRIAMMKEGLRLVLDHPLGWGYGRQAFYHAIQNKYGASNYTGPGHSHSGMLDLAIGIGLPGVGLWLLFLALTVRSAWRQASQKRNPTGLLICLLVLGFFSRSLIDSNLRDHMLEEFLLLLGIYMTLALGDRRATATPDTGVPVVSKT